MNRKPIFAANWKMNKGASETEDFIKSFLSKLQGQDFPCEIVIAPPFVSLAKLADLLHTATAVQNAHAIQIAAQNCSQFDSGAYTGDISGQFLNKLGCKYVLVGHSERRTVHNESDEVLNAKVKAAYRHGVTPVLCVGEGLEIRQAGNHVQHTLNQLRADVEGLTAEEAAQLVVAYEPVWAIGTGEVAGPEDAQEMCAAIRAELATLFGEDVAAKVRLLYGGSVKANNAAAILNERDVDGVLVGGASLDPAEFANIVRFESHLLTD